MNRAFLKWLPRAYQSSTALVVDTFECKRLAKRRRPPKSSSKSQSKQRVRLSLGTYSQEFKAARHYFKDCLEIDRHDKTIQLFLERTERHIEEGVEDGWAGVVQLDTK